MNTDPSARDDAPGDFLAAFRQHLSREGLKVTRQRERIASVFSTVDGHVSVDELLVKVREVDDAVGYATVYRTLKLLVEAGLASVRHFGEGFARYEPLGEDHHDHLLCESCGRIVEFHDRFIEERQEKLARSLGYRLTHHRHELFGVCAECLGRIGDDAVRDILERHNQSEMRAEEIPAAFTRYLGSEGLKKTRQRTLITQRFSRAQSHMSVDDLLADVRAEDATIGYATVYRTLKLLVEAGLAACRHFGDGFTRFEPCQGEHHDHFIDEETGEVFEFHDASVEKRQVELAKEYGFRLVRHRHDLFGTRLDSGSPEGR